MYNFFFFFFAFLFIPAILKTARATTDYSCWIGRIRLWVCFININIIDLFWFQDYCKYYAVNKWLIYASDRALFTEEYGLRLLGSRHMPVLLLLAVCQQRRVRNALIKRRAMGENLRKRTRQDPPLILICLTSSSRRGPINNKGALSAPAFMKRKPVHHNGSN